MLRLIVPLFLALVLPWGLVFSVNTLPPVGLVDSTQEHPIHCNRACSSYPVGGPRAAARHWLNTQQMNRLKTGRCRHAAQSTLPVELTSDHGLYGQTIRALHGSGSTGNAVYGFLNLALFVGLWPTLMFDLFAIALWQRLRLRPLKREGRSWNCCSPY